MAGTPQLRRAAASAPEGARIDPALSAALDILRFGAALTVLFGHASAQFVSGGVLWQFQLYMHGAVMLFFVLSGYVIAATSSRDGGAADYVSGRASRLLSVVVPALVLTFLFDALGSAANPDFYLVAPEGGSGPPADLSQHAALRYATAVLHIHEFWWLPEPHIPGSNVPFWSLSYEAAYYVIFGIAAFLPARLAIPALVALALLAGWDIVKLAPLWLLGACAWWLRPRIGNRLSLVSALAAIVLIGTFILYGTQPETAGADVERTLERYWAGFAALFAIVAIGGFSRRIAIGRRTAKRLRSVADHTFELYAVHYPAMFAAAALSPFALGDARRVLLIYAVVAAATIVTHQIAKRLRPHLRRSFFARLGRGRAATSR